MATATNLDLRSKAVVAYLDGRRLKGYIYNFSTQKDRFRLFLEQDRQQREGTDVPNERSKSNFLRQGFRGQSGI